MSNFIHHIKHIISSPRFIIPVILSVLVIYLIGYHYRQLHVYMKTPFFDKFGLVLDGWSLSHFLLYVYFGYNFPENYAEFLVIGLLWELIECSCKGLFNIPLIKDIEKMLCNYFDGDKTYWYGKLDDVAVNMMGFAVGAWLAR